MTIDVRQALRDGAEELATARGVVLYLLFTVFALASIPVHHTLTNDLFAWMQETAELSPEDLPIPETPLALDLSIEVLVLALAAIFVVSELLHLVAVRSFASEEGGVVPVDDVTRRFVPAFLTLVAVSLLVQVLVYVGAALLVPAIATVFLSVFVRQAIVLDDEGPIQSLKTTVSMTLDDPLSVVALLVVLFGISFVLGIPTLVVPPGTVAYSVAGIVFGTIASVYGIAVVTRAYQRATDESGADGEEERDEADDEAGVSDFDANQPLDADDLE